MLLAFFAKKKSVEFCRTHLRVPPPVRVLANILDQRRSVLISGGGGIGRGKIRGVKSGMKKK